MDLVDLLSGSKYQLPSGIQLDHIKTAYRSPEAAVSLDQKVGVALNANIHAIADQVLKLPSSSQSLDEGRRLAEIVEYERDRIFANTWNPHTILETLSRLRALASATPHHPALGEHAFGLEPRLRSHGVYLYQVDQDFFPPSVLLGTVEPYQAQIKLLHSLVTDKKVANRFRKVMRHVTNAPSEITSLKDDLKAVQAFMQWAKPFVWINLVDYDQLSHVDDLNSDDFKLNSNFNIFTFEGSRDIRTILMPVPDHVQFQRRVAYATQFERTYNPHTQLSGERTEHEFAQLMKMPNGLATYEPHTRETVDWSNLIGDYWGVGLPSQEKPVKPVVGIATEQPLLIKGSLDELAKSIPKIEKESGFALDIGGTYLVMAYLQQALVYAKGKRKAGDETSVGFNPNITLPVSVDREETYESRSTNKEKLDLWLTQVSGQPNIRINFSYLPQSRQSCFALTFRASPMDMTVPWSTDRISKKAAAERSAKIRQIRESQGAYKV